MILISVLIDCYEQRGLFHTFEIDLSLMAVKVACYL